MKTPTFARGRRTGYALILVLVFCAIGAFILASTLTRTANVTKLTERSRQLTVNISSAEAATEKIISRMIQDFRREGAPGLAANMESYRATIPAMTETPYWTNFAFNDAQGREGRTYVQCISNWTYVPLESQYAGLMGYAAKYRILSNTRNLSGPELVTGAVQQDVQLAQIPIFQFAIYYNSLLEFTWAAPFVVRGRVHANGDIYTGSAEDLTFHSPVTSSGTIRKRGWAGYSLGNMNGDINYRAGYATNVPALTLPIGTPNTPDAVREIINLPPAGESMYSALGTNRFYNKAELVLLVSNNAVQLNLKQPFDPFPTTLRWDTTNKYYMTNKTFPNWLTLTNTFTDARENKTIHAAQIDLGRYNLWALTNSEVRSKLGVNASSGVQNVPNLIYVADYRTNTATALSGIRLTNGAALPWRGLTVATPNPLYTIGNYNSPVLNSTNTTQAKPAALISDALTILSPKWNDANSSKKLGNRIPGDTTVNAAIITGIVYSDPSDGLPFSGGVMNLPRLLEDWNGKTLWLNTSVVNLYNSRFATNKWVSTSDANAYYSAPNRQFSFDLNFTDNTKLPPGTPGLSAMIRSKWVSPPPGVVNYAGN